MKIFSAIISFGWFIIAIMILGNKLDWWNYNLPDASAFCACLCCSLSTFLIQKGKS